MGHTPEPQPSSSMEEIMASKSCLYLGSDSLLDDYAYYLEYRAQRDLYDFCRRIRALSFAEALTKTGVSYGTFYRRLREYQADRN